MMIIKKTVQEIGCGTPAAQFRRTLICDTRTEKCPTRILRFPGPRQRPGGRPARGAETGRGGKGRWSAKRKASVVLELLRGADLESTSRKYGVTAAALTEWRDAFLAAGAEGLKIRQEDLVDEQGRRQMRVIAELAMENELLRERTVSQARLKVEVAHGQGLNPLLNVLRVLLSRAGASALIGNQIFRDHRIGYAPRRNLLVFMPPLAGPQG